MNLVARDDIESQVLANHYLAQAIAEAWRHGLMIFKELRFTLFVSNEYRMVFDDSADQLLYEEIVPTVRLWTCDGHTSDPLREFYKPQHSTPTNVFWPERGGERFDLATVVAFMKVPRDHAQKISVIEQFYSDESRRHTQAAL